MKNTTITIIFFNFSAHFIGCYPTLWTRLSEKRNCTSTLPTTLMKTTWFALHIFG
jgi:hypothetical protein